MKLELFTSNNCANCKAVKKDLREVLHEIGEDYEKVVVERNIEDSNVLAELLMHNIDTVPVIRIDGKVFEFKKIKDKTKLRKMLQNVKTLWPNEKCTK